MGEANFYYFTCLNPDFSGDILPKEAQREI